MKSYDHKKIEKKWQKEWAKKALYKTKEDSEKPKAYVLDMFPYPSGEGLHVGHPKGYIATDIYSRFKKMSGYNVLHPMGWDAFGLPAENYAIKNKVHPKIAVDKNIKRYKEQLSGIGFNYDWSREINTTDPKYYKWTQWIFLQMLKKGLAYQSYEPINWCPSCQTGLANEDLEDGKCERCGSVVEKRPMRQWVLKITDYAERLLTDIDGLNWPESIKESQRNWIGKSEGAEIDFEIKGQNKKISVFTTRPETIFGVTYVVLAAEHSFIQENKNLIKNFKEVSDFISSVRAKTEIERTAEGKDKNGIEIKGIVAINPATKEEIPVWIGDYALATYGTGAVMAVPAHDERDFAFAKKYGLSVKQVIEPLFVQTTEPGPYRPDEPTVNRNGIITIIKHWSEEKYICLKWKKVAWKTLLTGGIEPGETPEQSGMKEIREETGFLNPKFIKELGIANGLFYHVPKKENRLAHGHILYFELANGDRESVSENENEIHDIEWMTIPELEKQLTAETHRYSLDLFKNGYKPYTGEGILCNSGKFDERKSKEIQKDIVEFVSGRMVTKYKIQDWVFSRQRYWGEPIPVIHCEKCGVVPVPEKDLPVKLPDVKKYEPTGTGESPLAAIEKWVNVKCPTCKGKAKRETNTMPQWAGSCWYYLRYMDPKNKTKLVDPKKEKYWSPVDVYVGGAEHATRHLIYARFWHKFLFDIGVVGKGEPFSRLYNVGLILASDGRKMSKRYGNVVNPDEVVATYGADTFRIYEMFMGPFTQSSSWDTKNVMGSRRFIERMWRIAEKVDEKNGQRVSESLLHTTVDKVTKDIETFSFNTAISSLMILSREFENLQSVHKNDFTVLLQLLAPFAPHVTEELWAQLGYKKSIHESNWPQADTTKMLATVARIAVQINGKLRDQFEITLDSSEEEVKAKALASDTVQKWVNGKEIKNIIFVKNRLINIVVQ